MNKTSVLDIFDRIHSFLEFEMTITRAWNTLLHINVI
jgi:hypothetical protein